MQLCMRFHKIILDTIAIYGHLLHTVSIKIKPQALLVYVEKSRQLELFFMRAPITNSSIKYPCK